MVKCIEMVSLSFDREKQRHCQRNFLQDRGPGDKSGQVIRMWKLIMSERGGSMHVKGTSWQFDQIVLLVFYEDDEEL